MAAGGGPSPADRVNDVGRSGAAWGRTAVQAMRSVAPAQITMLVVAAVCLFFIVSFYGKSLESYRINQRAATVRQHNARLETEIKTWQDRVAYLSTEEYVETTAREKLNLVRPGDRSVVILPEGPVVATVAEPPADDSTTIPLFAGVGHVADWLALLFGPHP